MATFFQSLGWGQPDFPADAMDAAAKLMLSLLRDMAKEMTPSWQTLHLDSLIQGMVKVLPSVRTLLTQVQCQTDMPDISGSHDA